MAKYIELSAHVIINTEFECEDNKIEKEENNGGDENGAGSQRDTDD